MKRRLVKAVSKTRLVPMMASMGSVVMRSSKKERSPWKYQCRSKKAIRSFGRRNPLSWCLT